MRIPVTGLCARIGVVAIRGQLPSRRTAAAGRRRVPLQAPGAPGRRRGTASWPASWPSPSSTSPAPACTGTSACSSRATAAMPSWRPTATADGPRLRHFVAGLQRHAVAATALYAPYDNSYDRIVRTDSSPSRATWGLDDRLVAFRIPASSAGQPPRRKPPARRRCQPLPDRGGDAGPGPGRHRDSAGSRPPTAGPICPRALGAALDHLQADGVLRADPGRDPGRFLLRAQAQRKSRCAMPPPIRAATGICST